MRRVTVTSLTLFILLNQGIAQHISDALREVFTDAEYFLVEEDYYDALLEYEKIYKHGYKDNANINYRLGICYLNVPGKKDKAIPYLEKAIQNVDANYIEGSLKEEHAPLDALLYLGNAYRINNQLDKACIAYKKYNELDNKNVENIEYSKKQIEACKVASEMMKAPLLINLKNLGAPVNTSADNYKAVVTADESKIVYVTELKFYNAVFSSKWNNGIYSEPINLTPQIQSDGDQYPCYVSPDGNTLLLTKEDFFNSDIYISTYSNTNGEWQKSKPVEKTVNTKYWESHACLSPDGSTMFFTSNRKGGIGGMDLFMSVLDDKGNWGEPVNLGAPINTDLNEDTPFMLEDGKTLYFSSQGHQSMGGYDVFCTHKNEDGSWSEPENIGYPANTTDDDLFFQPVKEGKIMYKTQFLIGGMGGEDIYRVEILGKAEPAELVAQENIKVEQQPAGEGEDTSKVGEKATKEKPEDVEMDIPMETRERVVLKPIYFDYDKYNLDIIAKEKLDLVAQVMLQYKTLKLMVIGHTDANGSFSYNKTLSEKRARATTNYLISKGIETVRLEIKGQSESEPTAINTNPDGSDCPEGRRLNRRVEFKLMEGQFDNIIFEKDDIPENLRVH